MSWNLDNACLDSGEPLKVQIERFDPKTMILTHMKTPFYFHQRQGLCSINQPQLANLPYSWSSFICHSFEILQYRLPSVLPQSHHLQGRDTSSKQILRRQLRCQGELCLTAIVLAPSKHNASHTMAATLKPAIKYRYVPHIQLKQQFQELAIRCYLRWYMTSILNMSRSR